MAEFNRLFLRLREGSPQAYSDFVLFVGKLLYPRLVRRGLDSATITGIIDDIILTFRPEAYKSPALALSAILERADEITVRIVRGLLGAIGEAARVQSALFPSRASTFGDLRVCSGWRPVQSLTGDILDIRRLNDSSVLTLLGDVRGKGPPAALFGCKVLGLLAQIISRTHVPANILGELNNLMCKESVDALYVTMLAMHILHSEHVLTISNAASPPPMLCSASGVSSLETTGYWLGLNKDTTYETQTLHLQRGQVLFAYSDGVTDQVNSHCNYYGEAALHRFLLRAGAATRDHLIDALFQDLDNFSEGETMRDDQTALTISFA